MTVLHFLRHGEVHNPDRILYARLPRFRLSDRGREQAAAAGRYLADRPLATIYSSPLLRARQTAAAIATYHAAVHVGYTGLITETHTPYQGQPITGMEETGWNYFEGLPPGYETAEDVFERVQRFIQRVRQQHPGGEVVAISHGHVLLWMHLWVRGLPFNMETQFTIDPFPETASITTLTFHDGAALPDLTYHRPY